MQNVVSWYAVEMLRTILGLLDTALECRVEGNFEFLKAIVALLKTVFRPRRQATAKVGRQKLEKLIYTSFRIALNDRLGKTVGGGSQWGTMPCGLKPACAYVRRSLQNPGQTPTTSA